MDMLVDPEWTRHAACKDLSAEEADALFFPERGGKGNAGRALCRRCPVAEQCLELALTEGEAFGIWGGTSERERRYEGGPSVGIDRVEFLEARARFRRSSKC